MPIDYQQIYTKILEIGKGARERKRTLDERRALARARLNDYASQLDLRRSKVDSAKAIDQNIRCALPLDEPLASSYPKPDSVIQATFYRGGDRHGGHYYGRGYYGRGYYGGYYGSGVGVVIGWPWWWGSPWYYPYSYPYYPYYYPGYYVPQVTVPSSPPEYNERSRPEPSTTPSGVWSYCTDSNAYYPYVKECPSDWQTVPALPPEKPGR